MRKGYMIDKNTGEMVPREKVTATEESRSKTPLKVKNDRLLRIKEYCDAVHISLSALSLRCGLSRPTVGIRVREGDCTISDMEEMAAAAGYKFVWSWEKIDEQK